MWIPIPLLTIKVVEIGFLNNFTKGYWKIVKLVCEEDDWFWGTKI